MLNERIEVEINIPPKMYEIFAKIVGWPGTFFMRISILRSR